MNDVLKALLGPETTPLSCEACFEELDHYVESKLLTRQPTLELCRFCGRPEDCTREGECLGMRAHLESCPACHEEYESLRDLLRTAPAD
jgi:hypothetical protein